MYLIILKYIYIEKFNKILCHNIFLNNNINIIYI